MGFRDGVTRDVVESSLTDGTSLEPLLNEVEVKPGDVFFIRPGSVHALGAGITVLEPQRVRPFRRSVTYRFWDWNRRYDEKGEVDVNGRPRPLHIEEALAVTDWDGPRGEAFVRRCRRQPVVLVTTSSFTRLRVIDEPELFVEEWAAHTGTLVGVLCLAGQVELAAEGTPLTLHAGETAVIPAAVEETQAILDDARVMFCSVPTDA
jgi:mannose-6-phosphate isomerase